MTRPPRRALIVIDVQNEYVSGRLRIEHPPVQSSLQCIARAIDAAHAAGVPVGVVQNDAPESSPLFARGSAGHSLHEVVASRPHSHLVHKTLPSAFAGTDLADWLEQQRIDTVTIAGYMTHNCDAATAVDALHRGFTVELLSDASGAVPYRNAAGEASAEDIHRVFSVVLHSRFAAVVPTAAWIDAVQHGKPLERSNIFLSHEAAAFVAV
jgi:nicotinamidase-related amidase